MLSAECPWTDNEAENDESPWWKLVGVLLAPFLHGLCMCVDRPRVAEGMLPSLVSAGALLVRCCTLVPGRGRGLPVVEYPMLLCCSIPFSCPRPVAALGASFGGAISPYQQNSQGGGGGFIRRRYFAADPAHEP